MRKIKDTLENLGLDKKEVEIYLELIKKDNVTVSELSKNIKIDRTTIYDVIQRLMNKGIVSTIKINKSNHYKALRPKKMLKFFEEKHIELKSIIPELETITNNKSESLQNELFLGENGIKVVINDFLKNPKDYKAIGIRKDYEKILKYFTYNTINKLNELKIKETAIFETEEKFIKLKRGTYRQINKLPAPISTFIYNDTVIFFIFKEPYYAIRITNTDFRKLHESYFDLLWKNAKK